MKLQVWNMINFTRIDHYDVDDITDAVKTIHNLAYAQLKNPEITDNSFSLMMFNEGTREWEEWHDENYNEVNDYEWKDGKVVLAE